ncbi:hypothetical protein lacNasYZ03_12150 [Lactobacillus nasalidis]|uniref:TPM domain-containing protein n=1 Tax=Lactobacillus nasalidis TaxID=2797258 RepID=A0ABQ3W657_9LACO|nr:hypothetical protein lacNasYZ01_09150 [Lactobacillus nasalidis]GHV99196.1 hypothetical protein lacNasYZ02_06260 [Lactobacillus nasalidis]GHW01528.1 hypothetical protein lacNasYZ03_12150 [Lactobacillus nasalidis]
MQDNAGIIDSDTAKMVNQKNAKYQKTSEHPIVIVETLRNAKRTQPDGLSKATKTVYIVINVQKDGTKRAFLYSSSDLHSQFTAQVRANILSHTASKIAADDTVAFNEGVQELFKISVTLVDQSMSFKKDSLDLSSEELNRVIKPADLRIPIMCALIVLIVALIVFLRYIVKRQLQK